MRKCFTYILLAVLPISAHVFQASAEEQKQTTIADFIRQDSDSNVNIIQPEELNKRLMRHEHSSAVESGELKRGGAMTKLVGYRIQVFMDNNQRTAKSEAQIKERNITSRFPQIGTYLSYTPPYWRLRVGDFRTREEAVEMMSQIKKEFPGYAREIIIVRDRVNVPL